MVKTGVRIGTVWDRTTAFLSDHIGSIAPIALLTIFVPSSLSSALEAVATPASLAWAMVLVSLALALVSLLGQIALTTLVLHPATGIGAIGHGLARLLPALGIFVVVIVAIALLTAPIGLILYAYGAEIGTQTTISMETLPDGVMAPIALYTLFLVAVLVWITARLLVLTPVIVAERRGVGAIARAFALTRGMTFKLIGVLVLYGIVVMISTLAARGVFGAIFALVARGEDGTLGVAPVLTAVVVSAVTTVFTVIQAIFVAQLYRAIVADDVQSEHDSSMAVDAG